jgi:hypothetical protein
MSTRTFEAWSPPGPHGGPGGFLTVENVPDFRDSRPIEVIPVICGKISTDDNAGIHASGVPRYG